jgi:hypothetical protein
MEMRFVDWSEIPDEPEIDLTQFKIEVGRLPPLWFWNALIRKEIMPVPEPFIGQEDWAGDGIRVVKTGEFFPNGSIMSKGDLFSRSV